MVNLGLLTWGISPRKVNDTSIREDFLVCCIDEVLLDVVLLLDSIFNFNYFFVEIELVFPPRITCVWLRFAPLIVFHIISFFIRETFRIALFLNMITTTIIIYQCIDMMYLLYIFVPGVFPLWGSTNCLVTVPSWVCICLW